MTDLALRALERQLACGDHAARAQLLAARLRSGDLDKERLQLAAYAGDRDVLTVLPELIPRLGQPTGRVAAQGSPPGARSPTPGRRLRGQERVIRVIPR